MGWKAKGGNEVAQEDVYVWIMKCKDVHGQKHRYSGHLSLIK